MRKIVLIIILMSYLAVSSGVVVNFHYCMNRLASTELFKLEDDRCGKCGMDKEQSDGCCHDELQVVKLDDDQQITQAFHFESAPFAVAVHQPSAFIDASFIDMPGERHFINHSPPLLSAQDSYVQNRVFRI